MDTRFIEVAIGLALVFALTSLLVSILHEIYSSWRGSRGANLTLALRSLVADDPHHGGLLSLGRAGRPPSDFTRALLAHPLLVSQARGQAGDQDRPSYLPGDLVVSALLAQLVASHHGGVRPETPRQFLAGLEAAVPAAGPQPPVELRTTMAGLAQGTEADWPAYERRLVAWYDSVAERSIGWFKRWTQYRLFWTGLIVAFLLNINPLVVAPRLWDDEPLRRAMVAAGEAADQARRAEPAASGAAADEVAARAAVASLAAGARTPQAAEAARQSAQAFETDAAIAALEGSLTALVEARRTVDVAGAGAQRVERLLRTQIETKELVRLRRVSVADHDVPARLLDFSAALGRRLETLRRDADAARAAGLADAVSRAGEAIEAERRSLLLQALPDPLAQRCAHAADAPSRQLCERLEGLRSLGQAGLPIGWSWDNVPGCEAGRCRVAGQAETTVSPAQARANFEVLLARTPLPAESDLLTAWRETADATRAPGSAMWQLVGACARDQPCDWALMAAGWIIVALAAMLGAPFWFDLLGQLVKLRGSGGTPAAGKPAGPAGGDDRKGPGSGMLAPPGGGAAPGGGTPVPSSSSLSPAEAELSAERILDVQRSLGMPPDQQSGQWDGATRARIAAFQEREGLTPADGVLTADHIERLQRGAAAPAAAAAPVADTTNADPPTPRRADGSIAPLNEQQIREIYGDIATVPGNAKGFVRVTGEGRPGGAQRRLVAFNHPVLAPHAAGGCRVHEKALPYFKAVFDEIAANNLGPLVVEFGGTVVERHIGQDPEKRLSSHCWGIAIDLNTTANPLGAQPAPVDKTGTLLPLVEVFERHGFAWGGRFRNGGPDAMHFELALRAP